jgi:L-threonylcarbamoyladenylate synthase
VKTEILAASDPQALPRALNLLWRGELVAFPTDTVYGVGARPDNPEAIETLYQAKDRQSSKAIAILLASPDALPQVAQEMGPAASRLAHRFWPGPLTLVVPRHPGLPANLSPLPTIGVRMPDHPLALALLRAAGPLAVTSANLSGASSAVTAEEVASQLGGRIPLILDGGRTPGGVSSTVVDCTGPAVVVLRQGPVSEAEIRQALEDRN